MSRSACATTSGGRFAHSGAICAGDSMNAWSASGISPTRSPMTFSVCVIPSGGSCNPTKSRQPARSASAMNGSQSRGLAASSAARCHGGSSR